MKAGLRQLLMGARKSSALSAAKDAIFQNRGDVSILVIGDSTGNETTEWVYLFAQWLATQYPSHSVSYRLWDTGSVAYAAASAISTGSGSNTIRIWNASIAGTTPVYFMGSLITGAVVTPDPDLVIWNHGHNLVGGTALSTRSAFLSPMEQVRLALPNIPHAAVRQNPRRDDAQMDAVIAELDTIANDYGEMKLIDAYSLFANAGKPAGWYTDNVHPNATGQQAFLSAAKAAWTAARSVSYDPMEAFLATLGSNLLANSNFGASYAGGTPTSWSTTGSPTGEVETTIKDTSGVNLYNSATVTPDVFVSNLDGSVNANASYAASDYIPVTAGTPYALFKGTGFGVRFTCYFDANRAFVAGGANTDITNFTPPAGAAFVRITLFDDTVNQFRMEVGAYQSLKITGTTALSAFWQAASSTTNLAANGYATLAVRQYVPAGSAATVGRCLILTNDGTTTLSYPTSFAAGDTATDGFRWVTISAPVPSNVVYVRAYLYCDTAANASSTVYTDRAILVAGRLPKNI